MDYEPLLSLTDVTSVFRTGRGSTYAHHADATTTRNRSGQNHKDKSEGLQQRSGRTVFVPPEYLNQLGIFQNAEMATRFVPVTKDGKPTGYAKLELMEDYGPRKAGSVLTTVPYTTSPQVGLHPVEIWKSESPLGDAGRGIHFGNAITEVWPKPARLAGKAGVAGGLAGIAGAVKAATQGDYGPLREAVGEMVTPLGATPSTVNAREQEWIDRYGTAARKRNEEEAARVLESLRGDRVPMPEEYSKGGWTLI
jgi:hypothetical protein